MKTNYIHIDTSDPKLKGRKILSATLNIDTCKVEIETDKGKVILKGKKIK